MSMSRKKGSSPKSKGEHRAPPPLKKTTKMKKGKGKKPEEVELVFLFVF